MTGLVVGCFLDELLQCGNRDQASGLQQLIGERLADRELLGRIGGR